MDIRVSQYMSSNHGFSLPLTWEGPYFKKDLSINSGTVVFYTPVRRTERAASKEGSRLEV